MSIATVGPKKYDFQDLVCVFLFLRFEHLTGMGLHVEPAGGEDAKITYHNGSAANTIEIQVKGSEKPVTVSDVAEWLSHFPERQSSGTLLERLINQPDSSAVFVTSGRCVDALDRLVRRLKEQWPPHVDKIKRDDANTLLVEIDKYADQLAAEATTLKTARARHLKTLCLTTKPDSIRAALTKLTIVELVDDVELTYWCTQELRTKRLPLDRCEDVISRLRDLIKAGKESQIDITPKLRDLFQESLPERIRPKSYILRGHETAWLNELKSNNILLLSGSPRVGKSNAGRWIAAELEQSGYEVRRTRNLDEVGRFLLAPGDSERLALIDDPLGSTSLVASAANVLSQLRQLLPSLSASRKIIVCQVQDLLFEASQETDLRNVRIGKHNWHDLGRFETTFVREVWSELCGQFKVPSQLKMLVDVALEAGLHLEAGCLLHLAASNDRLEDLSDLDAAVRLAREDSKDLALSLREQGHAAVLQVLSVTTSPDSYCGEEELRFVLHGDDSEFNLAKADVSGVGVTFGAKLQLNEPCHENYQNMSVLSDSDILTVSSLEMRRIIFENESGQHNFSHPFYRSAAKNTLNGSVTVEAKRLINYLKRGIFSLSSVVSKSAAGSIDWVFSAVKSPVRRGEIVAVAIEGLDSRYLATRDQCFAFLLDHIEYLNADQADFSRWVSKVSWLKLNHVLWEKGEAVLPPGKTLTLESRLFETYAWEEVEVAFVALKGSTVSAVSSESAWKVICYLESRAGTLSKIMLLRLLSYDLGLMRAGASKLWLSVDRQEDADALQRIFSDRHPAVVHAALEAVIANWQKLSCERRTQLLGLLKENAQGPVPAVVMMPTLLQEQVDEAVLAALLPSVLRALPWGVRINAAKLFGRVSAVVGRLSMPELLEVIDGWIDLLEGLVVKAFPSDFLMGVAQIILDGITDSPVLRLSRLSRLASLPSTVARIRLVVELVNNWQMLCSEERTFLASVIAKTCSDQKWLQAAAVTRSAVPHELAKLVFMDGTMPTAETVGEFDSELIEHASRLYMGTYNVPSQVSAHRRHCKVWEPIIESFALDPENHLFEEAWDHLTQEADDAKISSFVRVLSSEHAQVVFERLFDHKVRCNGDFMPLAWEALLDCAPEGKLEVWFELMAQHSNSILEHPGEIIQWIGRKYAGGFLKLFASDIALLKLADSYELALPKDLPKEVRDPLLAATLERFEISPPRHYFACDPMLNFLRKLDFSEEQILPLQKLRSHLSNLPDDSPSDSRLNIRGIDGWLLPESFNK